MNSDISNQYWYYPLKNGSGQVLAANVQFTHRVLDTLRGKDTYLAGGI